MMNYMLRSVFLSGRRGWEVGGVRQLWHREKRTE